MEYCSGGHAMSALLWSTPADRRSVARSISAIERPFMFQSSRSFNAFDP